MRFTLQQAATRSEANGGRAYVYRTAETQDAIERDLARVFGARVDFHLGHRDGVVCIHAYENADEPRWGIDFLLVPREAQDHGLASRALAPEVAR